MQRFIPFDPNQPLLLPVGLRSRLPAGHSALLLADIAEQLDLGEVMAGLEDEAFGGRPGFDPRMLVRVWWFAYLLGIRSSPPAVCMRGRSNRFSGRGRRRWLRLMRRTRSGFVPNRKRSNPRARLGSTSRLSELHDQNRQSHIDNFRAKRPTASRVSSLTSAPSSRPPAASESPAPPSPCSPPPRMRKSTPSTYSTASPYSQKHNITKHQNPRHRRGRLMLRARNFSFMSRHAAPSFVTLTCCP
jgi:hypothetical protein